jgi:TRAP-type uncharacterized transport system fused permease subunit
LHGVFFSFTVHVTGICIDQKLTEVNHRVNISSQEIDLIYVEFVLLIFFYFFWYPIYRQYNCTSAAYSVVVFGARTGSSVSYFFHNNSNKNNKNNNKNNNNHNNNKFLLWLLASVERTSEQPLTQAVVKYAEERFDDAAIQAHPFAQPKQFRAMTGHGCRGVFTYNQYNNTIRHRPHRYRRTRRRVT